MLNLNIPLRPFKYYFIRADKNVPNKEYFKAKHDRKMADIEALADEIINDPTPPSLLLVGYVEDMLRQERIHKVQLRL